jgi:hypothetical protein
MVDRLSENKVGYGGGSMSHIYLWVRKDLSQAQRIIQACHAVDRLQYIRTEEVPNIVLFGVENEDNLYEIMDYLTENAVAAEIFHEPDIDAHTAIATYKVEEDRKYLFRKFITL